MQVSAMVQQCNANGLVVVLFDGCVVIGRSPAAATARTHGEVGHIP